MLEDDKLLSHLIEWAVWAKLDRSTELELILLKGHLLLEGILDSTLSRSKQLDCSKYSFYRKVQILDTVKTMEFEKINLIVDSLKQLNQMRNKLAHEFGFKIEMGGLDKWAKNILDNLEGEKFTNHTYRTKIVHAFSTMAYHISLIK